MKKIAIPSPISFPNNFVAAPNLPGYFWNIADRHLYSGKRGELRKLSRQRTGNYGISVQGEKLWVNESRFMGLGADKAHVLPTW